MKSNKRWGEVYSAVSWVVLCALGACESHPCPLIGCSISATLSGPVRVPEETTSIDARYCGDGACVGGTIVFHWDAALLKCASERLEGHPSGSVCVTSTAVGELEIRAELDHNRVPPDGGQYTLTLVDHDSGETLLAQTREAKFQTSHDPDGCQSCTAAAMRL